MSVLKMDAPSLPLTGLGGESMSKQWPADKMTPHTEICSKTVFASLDSVMYRVTNVVGDTDYVDIKTRVASSI